MKEVEDERVTRREGGKWRMEKEKEQDKRK
jgi:hypothetical protein